MPQKMERLAEAVATRKKELGLSQEAMRDNGGPSVPTISKILDGSGPEPSRATFAKLDRSLRWEAGSSRRIWDNGDDPVVEDIDVQMEDQRASFRELASNLLRPGVVVVQMSRVSLALELADDLRKRVNALPSVPEELSDTVDELFAATEDLWGSALASARDAEAVQQLIERYEAKGTD